MPITFKFVDDAIAYAPEYIILFCNTNQHNFVGWCIQFPASWNGLLTALIIHMENIQEWITIVN